VLPSDQTFRQGPPRPSSIRRPGLLTLALGEERYTVPGGGAIAVPIHAGDHVRVVDVEGMQACELVAADASGVLDPSILGARGDGDASGLKRILTGENESARSVRSGLERRGIDLSKARAVTLFGTDTRPGASSEFTVSRDGLLVVADDLLDLLDARGEDRWCGRDRDHRSQLEVRHRDPDRVEAADDADGGRAEPDLLVCLTQCRRLERGVLGVHRTAGQGDLAPMVRETRVAHGQRDEEFAARVGIQEEQGRGLTSAREARPIKAAQVVLCQGRIGSGPTGRQPRIDRNRAGHHGQGGGDHGLPIALSP